MLSDFREVQGPLLAAVALEQEVLGHMKTRTWMYHAEGTT